MQERIKPSHLIWELTVEWGKILLWGRRMSLRNSGAESPLGTLGSFLHVRPGGNELWPPVSTKRNLKSLIIAYLSPGLSIVVTGQSHLTIFFFHLKVICVDTYLNLSSDVKPFYRSMRHRQTAEWVVITESLIRVKNEENFVFSQKAHLLLASRIFSLIISAIFFRGFSLWLLILDCQ